MAANTTETTEKATEHSENFEKVKFYYNSKRLDGRRMWTINMVRNAVGKWITADEFKEITGDTYSES